MSESGIIQVLTQLDYWQIMAVVLKSLTYGMSFAAAGGVLFLALFSSLLLQEEDWVIRRVLVYATFFGLGLSVLRIGVMDGMLSGEWSGMFDRAMIQMVMKSSEGIATGLRVIGLFFIGVTMYKPRHGISTGMALFGAFLVVTSFAWVGHAGEIVNRKWAQALLYIHLLAVAFWLGALWPLHYVTYSHDIPRIAAIMHRFGKIAATIVSLLIVAGALLLWMLIGHLEVLWSSAYGQLFLGKLAFVITLLGLAAFNKLRLTPLLLKGYASAVSSIRRSIKLEIVVVGLILVTTATFTTVTGPTEQKSNMEPNHIEHSK